MTTGGAGPETMRGESPVREARVRVGIVEVFINEREGAPEEKRELEALIAELGDRIYPELVYTLIHKSIPSPPAAKELFQSILKHKIRLQDILGRSVSIQTASLDYLRGIEEVLHSPTVIEEEDVRELARLFIEERSTRIFDKDVLLVDLEKEIERTRRYGSYFALLLVDLDNLKQINETYGRLTGDSAIRRVDEILRANTRLVDTVYRFAEDEFAVLLPNADTSVAVKVADKLLKAVRSAPLRSPGAKSAEFSVTASIGAASFSGQTVRDADEVMDVADKLLFEAKKAGKNRIKILRESAAGAVVEEVAERAIESRGYKSRFVIRGTPISRGVAYGKVFVHKDILLEELKYYEITEEEIEHELGRVRTAFEHVKKDIARMERQMRLNLGREYGDIFAVHKTILSDVYLLTEMEEKLRRERVNAEQVVRSVFRRFENTLVTSGTETTRERSSDIADLARRVLRSLAGLERNIFRNLPNNRVVVAKRLLPSESVHLRKGKVRAIITEKGSRTSHAAILARGLGIPYVSETEYPIEEIAPDSWVIVDANKGEIIVNPTPAERHAVDTLASRQQRQNTEMVQRYKDLSLEKGGTRYRVMANINSPYNVQEAAEFGADGVGLYRIEQIYMSSSIFPSQEQLYRVLDEQFAAMPDKEIIVRLLDIGGDKVLPYINMKEEIYSFMGLRGVRVLLRYPKLLETQLVTFLRLSAKYRLKVLVPLVTLTEEIDAVRGYLERAKQALERSGAAFDAALPLGAMVEVPAAVVTINDLLRHADFISIGTNDLIQYTMASGRENAALAKYYEAGMNVVLNFIRQTVQAAKKAHIECGLCGEIAADTAFTERLLELGLTDFSVSPSNIPKLKSRIASLLGIQPAPVAARR